MKRAVILILIGSLVGCGQKIVYKPVPIHRPERPTLPRVTADRLQCLDDETYRTLARRQAILRNYAETLERIIDATRANDD